LVELVTDAAINAFIFSDVWTAVDQFLGVRSAETRCTD